jgi:hypothetical protein
MNVPMKISSLMLERFLLTVFGLVLGIVVARSSVPPFSADSAVDLQALAGSTPIPAGHLLRRPVDHPGYSGFGREQDTKRPDINAILGKSSRYERMRLILTLTDRLDSEAFPNLLNDMREAGQDMAYPHETMMILSAWADRDPMDAANYLRKAGGELELSSVVMSAWAAADPDAAEKWARDNHGSVDSNPWMVGVIQGIARSDQELARSLIEEMPQGRGRKQALTATLAQVFLNGGEAARAWIDGIADARIKNDGAEWLAGRMAERDPVSASAWVSSLETAGARSKAAKEVASRYALHDMESAQEWALTLPEDTRMEAIKGVVEQLARQDPVDAFNWISNLGGSEKMDGLLRDIVRRGFDQDPAAALTTSLYLQDNRNREQLTSRYLERWVESDPAAASIWIHAHSDYLPENLMRHLPGR